MHVLGFPTTIPKSTYCQTSDLLAVHLCTPFLGHITSELGMLGFQSIPGHTRQDLGAKVQLLLLTSRSSGFHRHCLWYQSGLQ